MKFSKLILFLILPAINLPLKTIAKPLCKIPSCELNFYSKLSATIDTIQAPPLSWADSIFNSLTTDEKIAQLFMVAAFSNKDKKHQEFITSLICERKIGGLIFFQGGPVREANLTNYYQGISKVPLLISIDGEWGLAMRLDSTFKFPRQMTLGALQNDSLVFEMGAEIAKHCKRLGIQINFAPVIDVNNNPANPVISNRSFGENKYKVAEKGAAYMKGMQGEHIMATGKHFPGHGDTDSDSHLTLPIVNQKMERIDSLELYPFKKLFKEGLMSTMVAHLFIPALDTTTNIASTLSRNVVTDLLKEKLGFKGLIFTDALNMKGVAKFYDPGLVDVKALLSGNDVLLNAEDVPKAMEQIKEAIYQGLITQEEIDLRCMKILRGKQWCGLNNYTYIKTKNIVKDLNPVSSLLINREIIKNSVTLLKNENKILPIKNVSGNKIACIAVNEKEQNSFQQHLSYYADVKNFTVKKNQSFASLDSVIAALSDYGTIITGLFNIQSKPENNFGLPDYTNKLIDTLNKIASNITVVFGNPYSLTRLSATANCAALLELYEDNNNTEQFAAQAIFGTSTTPGTLPVTIPGIVSGGTSIQTEKTDRVQFVVPEELMLKTEPLAKIDSICNAAIKQKAFPGCQVVAAKDGKIFYNKAFGKTSYTNGQEVTTSTIYDLASVTKVASTTLALMKLTDEGKIDVTKKLSDYLPELDSTNKKDIIIKDMLAHQAGLPSWIPFFKKYTATDSIRKIYFNNLPTDSFPHRVAEDMYARFDLNDSIYKTIYNCPLGEKKYLYSDLGYYFLKKIIEKITGVSLDTFVTNTFYNPMGLWSLRYKPRQFFALDKLAPTELDLNFRKQLLDGDVHDQGAAMLGGIGGHAGLFGNAVHVATLVQMMLNKGSYAGIQYITPETINLFNTTHFINEGNRRGLCFDKPETQKGKDSPACESASPESFGHSGFTGTYIWADPANGLVYVFLSNRVHPEAENKKITQLGIRTQIHELLYKAVR